MPSSTSSTSTTSTSTTTTAPAPEFEPLLADPSLTPEEQVEQAYLFSWDIYLDAVERGDTSFLHLAYADEALDLVASEVERLSSAGQMVLGSVGHDYAITETAEGEVVVLDAYTNHLVLHDAVTGQPLESDPNTTNEQFFAMRKVGDAWLVVDIFGGE
ncbi:hypothetical protein [Actinomarinicola tropica]|uniref:Nuclear transport factor 2 family protein n=1 Tax=Actinomarinicola tropica TaxID=2789776 RepID=A0A5Q2RGJ4_9ACTN|nr:hypothetical protein [Actinomarinicola tropica]QGG93932.1 hypothetical protein GH723_01765 [Actinomarinicola tropica]